LRLNINNPIIIISVFRSGSNLIKEILCQLPGFGGWPAESINFIWRHGNALRVDDELSINDANDYVKNYIRKAFSNLSIKYGYKYIVEKTDQNSLRVGFVNEIFPDANFIFVVRDGRDAIASMLKRRHQSFSLVFRLRFLLNKAKYIPISDIPIVATRNIKNMFQRFFIKKVVFQLGPVFKDMKKMINNHHSEIEIVALQWAKSIEKSYKEIKNIEPNRVHIIKYEKLVTNSEYEIIKLLNFLNIELSDKDSKLFFDKILFGEISKESRSPKMKTVEGISNKSVGRWKMELDDDALNTIMPIIENSMKILGY
jgi:hypothetical protein